MFMVDCVVLVVFNQLEKMRELNRDRSSRLARKTRSRDEARTQKKKRNTSNPRKFFPGAHIPQVARENRSCIPTRAGDRRAPFGSTALLEYTNWKGETFPGPQKCV